MRIYQVHPDFAFSYTRVLSSVLFCCWFPFFIFKIRYFTVAGGFQWHSCKSIYIHFKVLLTSTVDCWNHYCIYCCICQSFSNIALIMHILLWWFYPKHSQKLKACVCHMFTALCSLGRLLGSDLLMAFRTLYGCKVTAVTSACLSTRVSCLVSWSCKTCSPGLHLILLPYICADSI